MLSCSCVSNHTHTQKQMLIEISFFKQFQFSATNATNISVRYMCLTDCEINCPETLLLYSMLLLWIINEAGWNLHIYKDMRFQYISKVAYRLLHTSVKGVQRIRNSSCNLKVIKMHISLIMTNLHYFQSSNTAKTGTYEILHAARWTVTGRPTSVCV